MGGSRSVGVAGSKVSPLVIGFISQEVGRGGFQSFGEFRDHRDRRVPDLPLNAGDVGAVDLRPRRKFFLREVQPFSGCLDVSG